MSGFCTDCGHRVDSFDGLRACPACGSPSQPCADADQLSISINWQELRILVMWAENWQRQHDLGRTVYAIARRIKAQLPDRDVLTFADEMGEIARAFPDAMLAGDKAAELRRDIAEQTGEEFGL